MNLPLVCVAASQNNIPEDTPHDYIMVAKIEAAARGVPLAVTIRNGSSVEHLTVEVGSLRVDQSNMLEFSGPSFFRRIALSGERAPAILPEVVPMDRRQQLMQAASNGIARLRETAAALMACDGISRCLVRSDLVLVNSTGIYPYGALGVEWDEVLSVSSQATTLTVTTPGRTLELKAS